MMDKMGPRGSPHIVAKIVPLLKAMIVAWALNQVKIRKVIAPRMDVMKLNITRESGLN